MPAEIVIHREADRAKVIDWTGKAPWGTRVRFYGPKRSLAQNDKLWPMLTEVATQIPWHGVKLTPDDWKLIFLDALKREIRLAPNLDSTGFVNLGRSSSALSKQDFSDLIELITAWGVSHGVQFQEAA